MPEQSKLSVLIIDPSPSMRGTLHSMLNQSAISHIDYASSAGTAIRQLSKKSYDIVLCEFDLSAGANGQNGQQLLEDLRHQKLIDLQTIFIMLTAEGVFSNVLSAAELTPTDYILKPFTGDMLNRRIARALKRRAAFLPVYELIDQGSLREAIKACRSGESGDPLHAAEFLRLRAELYLTLGELDEAEQIYQAVLVARPLPWASLGMAKTLFAQQRFEEALEQLDTLIEHHPQFMAAYDMVARTHEAMGQTERAKKALEEAVAISPHMLQRNRHLGAVALETGDVALAEHAFRQVMTAARHSEFRDPEDHLNLVKALVKKGDAEQAGGIMRDMERTLRDSANAEACRAIGAALLLDLAGNSSAAANELTAAVGALGAGKTLSTNTRMGLVRNCLDQHLDQAASTVMEHLMNDADSAVSREQAVKMFEQAGRPDLARGMGAKLEEQVQDLMQDASEKAGQGDHRAAVTALSQALRKAPGNVGLLLASVQAILRQLDELGWEPPLAEQAHNQMQSVARLAPGRPELGPLRERYAAIRHKYGIAI